MEKIATVQTNEKTKSEYIFVIYDKVGCYLRECKTLVEVAKFFGVSKQAISNYLRYTKQPKDNFKYKEYSIEYFDLNGIY